MKLITALCLTLLLAGCAAAPDTPQSSAAPQSGETIFCAQDTFTCPNGTIVSRDPAKGCDFASCTITDISMSYSPLPLAQVPASPSSDTAWEQTRAVQAGDLIAQITTTKGDIWLRLFEKETPKTVENFTRLAAEHYYDGIIFHRVIDGFMVQTGDPTGTGTGGNSIFGSTFEDEFVDSLSNIKGAVAMANRGPATNGSQFFIVQGTEGATYLDGRHTVFGQVFSGMDTVDAIAKSPRDSRDKPLSPISMSAITLYRVQQ